MKYYCHFNEIEINPEECKFCKAKDCCLHNLEIIQENIK